MFLVAVHSASASVVLSDNIGKTVARGELVTSNQFVASSFGTDASFYSLKSVALFVREVDPGSAEAEIYTDDSFQPGALVGALSSPGVFPADLAPVLFSGNGILLSPWTTYWVVLSTRSGSYEWAWTEDSTGEGVGFQHTFGISFDGGATWPDVFPQEPQLMTVTADPVPEPAVSLLVACGIGAISLLRKLRYPVVQRF